MCLCDIRLLISTSISYVYGHNFLWSYNRYHSQTYADLVSAPMAIQDWTLDETITLYLLLDIVRAYAISCTNSMRYNREALDFWVTFWRLSKVRGIYFMRVIRVTASCLRKLFVQCQHQCRINFAVPSDTTLQREITEHKIEGWNPEQPIPY